MRIVIADDEVLLREGLSRLLEEAGLQVVGKVGEPEALMRKVGLTRPDVVILDIRMPPTYTDEGLVAAGKMNREHPEVGVLLLSHYLDSRYAMRLLEQHPGGAGYLLKERVSDVAVLTDALHRIAEGECVVDPTIVLAVGEARRDRTVGRADRPGGRSAEADGRGPFESRHLREALSEPQDGRGTRQTDLPQARAPPIAGPAPPRARRSLVPAGDMSAELPAGTLTFLFTDVEGSTRLVKQLGGEYANVLLDQQRLLRAAVTQANGREIDTQGDAFFVVFLKAKDAVAGALAAQRSLQRHRWPAGVDVRVRMGIHTGEPGIAGDRYFGLGVHRAARICAAGHGGQMLLSQSTYGVLVDDVLPDIRFLDLGEYRLKDFERLEHIFQLVVLDLPHAFPPLRVQGEIPFSGRERELAAGVAATLGSERVRVVVADDSVLLRDGLCRLLDDGGFDVVGRAGDAEGLLQQVSVQRPDVVITDIRMPPTHTDEGLVAARKIRGSFPEVGVLVLSQHLDARYAIGLLEGYPERVGYLLKERVSDVAILTDAVHRIAEGECVIDPTIVSQLVRRQHDAGPLADATAEDREVVSLVAEGYSDGSIAERLGIDAETVHHRVERTFARLGVTDSPNDLRRVRLLLRVLRS